MTDVSGRGRQYEAMLRRSLEPGAVPPEGHPAYPRVEALVRAWSGLTDVLYGSFSLLRMAIGFRWVDLEQARLSIARVRQALDALRPDGFVVPEIEDVLAATEADLARARIRWRGRVLVRFMPLLNRLWGTLNPLTELECRTAPEEVRRSRLASQVRDSQQSASYKGPAWIGVLVAAAAALTIAWMAGVIYVTRHLPLETRWLVRFIVGVPGTLVVVMPLFAVAFDFIHSRRMLAGVLGLMGAETRWARLGAWQGICPGLRRALKVTRVDPESDLERAGVQVGDSVVAMLGVPVDRYHKEPHDPDHPRTITVVRQGALFELSLVPPSQTPR